MVENNIRELFTSFDRVGLASGSLDRTIGSWTETQALDFVHQYDRPLPTSGGDVKSIFRFVPNAALSGRPAPCVSWDCRLKHVDQLARFAAFYGDEVLLPHPFHELTHFAETRREVKAELHARLVVLNHLRPLFEAGIVRFMPLNHSAVDLHRWQELDDKFDGVLAKARKRLKQVYSAEVDFAAAVYNGMMVVEATGPDDVLFGHRTYRFSFPVDGENEWEEGKVFRLSKKAGKRNPVMNILLHYPLEDLREQNWYALRCGANYLTHRPHDFEALEVLNEPTVNRASRALLNALAHEIPLLSEVPVDRLVRLRETEPESFQVYRDALTAVLADVPADEGRHAAEAFNDLVRPEINNINLAIRSSRRMLLDSVRQDVVFAAGFVSVGLFSGWLPPELGKIVGAIGGVKHLSDVLGKLNRMTMEPDSVRNAKFYFLWKAGRPERRLLSKLKRN